MDIKLGLKMIPLPDELELVHSINSETISIKIPLAWLSKEQAEQYGEMIKKAFVDHAMNQRLTQAVDELPEVNHYS